MRYYARDTPDGGAQGGASLGVYVDKGLGLAVVAFSAGLASLVKAFLRVTIVLWSLRAKERGKKHALALLGMLEPPWPKRNAE